MARGARGEPFSHRSDVPDSPGWSDEQKERVDRMWAEIRELSVAVVDHSHWATVTRVGARMELKRQARPADDAAEAA